MATSIEDGSLLIFSEQDIFLVIKLFKINRVSIYVILDSRGKLGNIYKGSPTLISVKHIILPPWSSDIVTETR